MNVRRKIDNFGKIELSKQPKKQNIDYKNKLLIKKKKKNIKDPIVMKLFQKFQKYLQEDNIDIIYSILQEKLLVK